MSENATKAQSMRRLSRRVLRSRSLIVAGAMIIAVTLVSPYRIRREFIQPPASETISADDGAPLNLAVWRPGAPAGPGTVGVVFIHGFGVEGPLAPGYSLLCEALARRGCLVVAPFMRGYANASAHQPQQPFDAERWDPQPDIAAAVRYLQTDASIGLERIVVIGHSLGGGYALLYGLAEPSLGGIISFSRLDMERRWSGEGVEDASLECTKVFDLDAPPDNDAILEFLETQALAFGRMKDRLRDANHPPILFLVGGREKQSDHEWLRRYTSEVAGDARFMVLPNTDHWLNVRKEFGLALYNRHRIGDIVTVLLAWIDEFCHRSGDAS